MGLKRTSNVVLRLICSDKEDEAAARYCAL